jgi:hypothetical protein
MITFDRLKHLSFLHSAIYLTLLASWAAGLDDLKLVCGWGHGIGWIVMSLLCIAAVRMRVIPLWLAVMVSVVGCVGPFTGSIAFIVCQRREPHLERGMV